MEKLLNWPAAESFDTRWQVIRWWESRRFRFNVYLLAVGALGSMLVLVAGSAAVKPGVDFVEPMALFFGPFVYLFFANICYSFGWMVDTVFFRRMPGIRLYKSGVLFSVALTALPGFWAVIAWLMTMITGKKLD